MLEGNHTLVDEMADTPKRKITKKSSSFSYDRRRDSVKVRRQSKSLSFKSATPGSQKRQAQKKQVCIFLLIRAKTYSLLTAFLCRVGNADYGQGNAQGI